MKDGQQWYLAMYPEWQQCYVENYIFSDKIKINCILIQESMSKDELLREAIHNIQRSSLKLSNNFGAA